MERVWTGCLQKMRSAPESVVRYWLEDGAIDAGDAPASVEVNSLLGKHLTLRFDGLIRCTACGVAVERSFDNGYCENCVRTRADADICMMRPERCHHGNPDYPCRDEEFAQTRCFQPHYLYCSLTSDVKVGITRHTNLLQRWMDQGAVQATTLALLPNRRAVGDVEHELAVEFKDRTHWMNMLRTREPPGDLDAVAEAVVARLVERGVPVLPPARRTRASFSYPVQVWPEKVKPLSFRKTDVISGVLQGIKGQYWYFPTGVLNVRKHSGYAIDILAGPAAEES